MYVPVYIYIYIYSNSRNSALLKEKNGLKANESKLCRAQETKFVAAIGEIEAKGIYIEH
jgi:hypothetical protein